MRRLSTILAECQASRAQIGSCLQQLSALDGARNPEASRLELKRALIETERLRDALLGLQSRFNRQPSNRKAGA